MPCEVSDISIDVTAPPPVDIPGFGPPFSPIQVPLPDLDLPTDLVEDILALMNQLGALFPSGLFKANLDSTMKNVLDFIASILNQIAPFLSFYNFIIAALNMIICVIEVLCAIPNPFAVASKLKRLFAECLPPFLLLFPWLALIAMILALLLLILALIQYIIETILGIIEQLIRNIQLLTDGLTLQDTESTLAAAEKIASLLCLIESLLAVFIAIAAIIAIIQSLAAFAGSAICDEGDDSGCCPPEICPDFIRLNNEIQVTEGTLTYYSQIGSDLSSAGLPASLVDLLGSSLLLREERWQLYENTANPVYPINSIITPTDPVFFGGSIFYPEQEFAADTPPNRSPYTVDMTLFFDPTPFNPLLGGARTFVIKDCIVVRKPINGLRTFNNLIFPGIGTGTFDLEGGLVFEDDGETPVELAGQQLTLNDFISLPASTATDLPATDDGYTITDVEFIWKPQHSALAGFSLITVGCFPEVALEKAVQNNFILSEGIGAVIDAVPEIGNLAQDVLDAQQCAIDAINKYRESINLETTETFQSEIIQCLTDLEDQVTSVFCDSFLEAVSAFESTFTIDPNVQFTTRPINVTVTLSDGGGTNISNNLPNECLSDILGDGYNGPILEGNVTLGEISDFQYDSANGVFTAEITSEDPGIGELRVSFNNQVFSRLVPVIDDFNTPSSIEEQVVTYEFIDESAREADRRDRTDVAGEGN